MPNSTYSVKTVTWDFYRGGGQWKGCFLGLSGGEHGLPFAQSVSEKYTELIIYFLFWAGGPPPPPQSMVDPIPSK